MKMTDIEMIGFKKYIEPEIIELCDFTVIRGHNGSGKSTVADALPFVLFGTDAHNNKLSPQNLFDPGDTAVRIRLIDRMGEGFELERGIVNGKNKLFINQVPVKATEFKELVETFFTKEKFFTLYNPTFFASQHWTAQREQFMTLVDEPTNMEVFKKAGKMVEDALSEEIKKLNTKKLADKYREIKKRTDAEMIRLEERVKVFKESSSKEYDLAEVTKKREAAEKQLAELEKTAAEVSQQNERRYELNRQMAKLTNDLDAQVDKVNKLKESSSLEICVHCGQDLPNEKIVEVNEKIKNDLEEAKKAGAEMVERRKKLKAEIENAGGIVDIPKDGIRDLQNEILDLREKEAVAKSTDYTEKIEQARAEYKTARDQNVNANSILTAIKQFDAAKMEVMAEAANQHFEKLGVKLFKPFQDGSFENTFELEYEGKPYSTLSTAERIKAGLELRGAFVAQLHDNPESGQIAPVFIDNAESISSDLTEMDSGQVIAAYVTTEEFEVEGWNDHDEK